MLYDVHCTVHVSCKTLCKLGYSDVFQEEVRISKEALQRSEESADLLAEKSYIAEQEALLLQVCTKFARAQ